MNRRLDIPNEAITLDNRYGKRYPKTEGYYGFIISEKPAMHVWQDKIYTIDVYKNKTFVNTITCKHGEW